MVNCIYKKWGSKYYFIAFENQKLVKETEKFYCSEHFLTTNIETLPHGSQVKIFSSISINLQKSNDELFADIDKNTRYDIRRAERDGVHAIFLDNENLSLIELKKFMKFFNKFAKQKHLPKINRQLLFALSKNHNLLLSYALDSNNNILVYHLYIKDNEHSVLQYSCSLYRNKNLNGQLIGRSNRYLHYSDLIYLKNENIMACDLGGISDRSEIHNIVQFKKDFGGDIVEYKNISIYDNKNTTIIIRIKDLMKKLLKR